MTVNSLSETFSEQHNMFDGVRCDNRQIYIFIFYNYKFTTMVRPNHKNQLSNLNALPTQTLNNTEGNMY